VVPRQPAFSPRYRRGEIVRVRVKFAHAAGDLEKVVDGAIAVHVSRVAAAGDDPVAGLVASVGRVGVSDSTSDRAVVAQIIGIQVMAGRHPAGPAGVDVVVANRDPSLWCPVLLRRSAGGDRVRFGGPA